METIHDADHFGIVRQQPALCRWRALDKIVHRMHSRAGFSLDSLWVVSSASSELDVVYMTCLQPDLILLLICLCQRTEWHTAVNACGKL